MAYYLISGTMGHHTGYTQDFEKVIWRLTNSARKNKCPIESGLRCSLCCSNFLIFKKLACSENLGILRQKKGEKNLQVWIQVFTIWYPPLWVSLISLCFCAPAGHFLGAFLSFLEIKTSSRSHQAGAKVHQAWKVFFMHKLLNHQACYWMLYLTWWWELTGFLWWIGWRALSKSSIQPQTLTFGQTSM